MGKCFSCCQEPDHCAQNGHVGSTTPSKTPPSTAHTDAGASHTKYLPEVPQHAHPPPHDPHQGRSVLVGVEKKMYISPYPKQAPVRKLSNHEGKRTSLTSREYSESKIYALFDQYKDQDEDCILAEGIESFCKDLELRPEEFRVLVLAWNFDAETMCRFTRQEFVNGCKKLHTDSIKGIQSKFPDMLSDLQNKQTFKELYRWTYRFGLDTDVGQRTLPVDMAISLWQLVFSLYEPPILKRWLAFLEKHPSIRGIPKDTWDMFLNFTEVVGDDLSTYDDTEAWPSLFDDFVEYENDRQNQNVTDKHEKEYYD